MLSHSKVGVSNFVFVTIQTFGSIHIFVVTFLPFRFKKKMGLVLHEEEEPFPTHEGSVGGGWGKGERGK